MAMTPAGLAAKLKEELGTAVDSDKQDEILLAYATAIVEYIQQNAVAVTPQGNGTIQ